MPQVLEGLQGLPRRRCGHPQLLVQSFGTAESGGELQEVPGSQNSQRLVLGVYTVIICLYCHTFPSRPFQLRM